MSTVVVLWESCDDSYTKINGICQEFIKFMFSLYDNTPVMCTYQSLYMNVSDDCLD